MIIAVAFYQAGFTIKTREIEINRAAMHEVLDKGTFSTGPVVYPAFAQAEGDTIQRAKAEHEVFLRRRGISTRQ